MNINDNIMELKNSSKMELDSTSTNWKKESELLLKEWADKAQCFRWLHARSQQKYRIINAWFTIPVIILSTVTGTANFAQEKVPAEYRGIMVVIIGSLNIIAGIISTIAQYLKVAEINEGHRIASLSWGKFHRRLKVELSSSPDDRSSPLQLVKDTREEYDRLVEISPPIPDKIIQKFMEQIVSKKIKEQKENSRDGKKALKRNQLNLQLPEICGEINPTHIYEEVSDENSSSGNVSSNVVNQMNEIQKINEFKANFKRIHGREPNNVEIKNSYNNNNMIDNSNDMVNVC